MSNKNDIPRTRYYYHLEECPVGWLALLGTERGLQRVSLQPDPREALDGLGAKLQIAEENAAMFAESLTAFRDYFGGDNAALARIALDMEEVSAFYAAAWQACRNHSSGRDALVQMAGQCRRQSQGSPGCRAGHGQKPPGSGCSLSPGDRQWRQPARLRRRRPRCQGQIAGNGTRPGQNPLNRQQRYNDQKFRQSHSRPEVLTMAGQKFTSWVHGSAMTGEYLNRITSVRHCGPFVRIEGNEGQNTWLHFAIPTPTIRDGNHTKAESVSVAFRARSHANVHEVLVYDGEKIIAEHQDLGLKGDHLDSKFEIPGGPEVDRGINVVVGVTFDAGAPDVRAMQVEIVGVGVDFEG